MGRETHTGSGALHAPCTADGFSGLSNLVRGVMHGMWGSGNESHRKVGHGMAH